MRVACGDFVRRLEDVLLDEAGDGAAQHAERVPAEVRPIVDHGTAEGPIDSAVARVSPK